MEPRKATDVLLDLESKIDSLINNLKNQDLLLKVMSNKLNSLIEKADKQPIKQTVKQTPMSETANNAAQFVNSLARSASVEVDSKNVLISSEDNIPLSAPHQNFSRTSRPETFAGDNAFLKKESKPKEAVITIKNKKEEVDAPKIPVKNSGQSIPIMQRVVDKNGKSIFLAEVEVSNSAGDQVFKGRTNGTGKWMASLPIASYKVVIRKKESITKQTIEVSQNINVDGSNSQIELPVLIMK